MNSLKERIKEAMRFFNTYNIIKAAAFPLLILWLELILHIFMRSNMKYLPIYTLFSFSAGFLLSALCLILPHKASRFVSLLISSVISLLYIVEFLSRIILQTYYQPSTLGVAMENKLSDYSAVIIENIFSNIFFIILAILPCVLIYFVFKTKTADYKKTVSLLCVILFILFHLFGLLSTNLFTKDEINPEYLYYTDTNIDDQVEQLGLYTMIRLDFKHMLFPPKQDVSKTEFVSMDIQTVVPVVNVPENTEILIETDVTDTAKEQAEEPILDTSPNILNVDLAAMANESTDSNVQYLTNYFQSITPTNKNEFTGIFKDYNVIFFTLEAFSGYAVDPELTPTLYKMINEGFVFNNFYSALHYTSTSNGECQNLLGLYPKNGNPISMRRTGELKTNTYFGLARQLERLGYTNIGYHNNGNMYGRNLSHPNLGYDWRYHDNGLEYETSSYGSGFLWPQRDSFMIEASVDDYLYQDSPFNIYYLTITGHTPYSWNWAVKPYKDSLSHLPYSEKTKSYVATVMEVDKMMATLIEKLEQAGKLENTLIVAAPDHIPYSDVEVLEELCAKTFGSSDSFKAINESNIDFEVYKNSLIIWSASMTQPIEINKVTCQVDILPTVSNLLGLEYDSRMLAGSDALSEREGLVIFSSRCWKTDRGFYNRFNQTFSLTEGIEMTEAEIDEYVNYMKKAVTYKLDCTAKIIESNFYDKMLQYIIHDEQ